MEKLERTEFIRRFKDEDNLEYDVVLIKHNKSKDAFMRLVKEYSKGTKAIELRNKYTDEAMEVIETEDFAIVYLGKKKTVVSIRVISLEEYKYRSETLIEELAVERINIDQAIKSFKKEDVRRNNAKKKEHYNSKLDKAIGKQVLIPVYLEERVTYGEYTNEPKNGFMVRTLDGEEICLDLTNGVIFPDEEE